MILSHEIPQGSKLYFGKSAKIKRDLENLVSEVLYKEGYEEIQSPAFSYLQYQRDVHSREVVRINNENNESIALRNDSTIDTIRLIAPHLKENLLGKKWFYIQPVFVYPTQEINQIGVENLENCDILPFIKMSLDILQKVKLHPFLQLSNVKIPQICAKEFDLDLEIFMKNDMDKIAKASPFLQKLLEINNTQDLENLIKIAPQSLQDELQKLLDLAKISYDCVVLAPLDYPKMAYYDGTFFRFFLDNHTIILGGGYTLVEQRACGFGIYTDNMILSLRKEK